MITVLGEWHNYGTINRADQRINSPKLGLQGDGKGNTLTDDDRVSLGTGVEETETVGSAVPTLLLESTEALYDPEPGSSEDTLELEVGT